MRIWVDADACPATVRDILCRAAERTRVRVSFIANQPLRLRSSKVVDTIRVTSGFDVADNEIVKRVSAGDLVVTADIPLAAEVIAKGGHAMNPRGELYTAETVGAKLNMRDFMETMRACGVHTGGPPPLNNTDRKAFSDQLDRLLTRHRDAPDAGRS